MGEQDKQDADMSVQEDIAEEVGAQETSGNSNQGSGDMEAQTVVDCGTSLDITLVKDFSETLKQSLAKGKPVVLNAANVENADGAAMQLLYAFFHDAKANDVALSWDAPSEALKRSASLLGMSTHLELN